MDAFSVYQLWYGRDEPPPAMRRLTAGSATLLLDGADLRYLRVHGREIVRRLYVAVRDQNWATIPGRLSDLSIEEAGDRFAVRFLTRHRRESIDFVWRGEIAGAADGTISYTMDSRAEAAFRYNRIGICVLHPPAESAGRPYRGRTPEGGIEGHLPERIGPQRIEGGQIFALFPAVHQLTISLTGGGEARFDFNGDLFEMEDQRNWTDGSFKTYSTPLALPFPRDAAPGQVIRQRVTVATAGLAAGSATADGPTRLTIGPSLGIGLPPIGLGLASHDQALSAAEAARLRLLRPAHLRVDLALHDPAFPDRLTRARREAAALDCPLELALFVTDPESDLGALADRLSGARIARVLVFHAGRSSGAPTAVSTGPLVTMAKARLGPVLGPVPFAGGTDFYFTELNRSRPDPAAMDAVVYSINPQIHAFDETSLVETLAEGGETVRSARAFSGGRPVLVSPVTLRPRYNTHAAGPEAAPPPGELPAAVDPRQMSLFGAVWTLGSIKYLAESGAAGLTYYETTGWRGVMATADGSPLPERFPARPGMLFPLYHLLGDLAEWRTGAILACASSAPLTVIGLALRDSTGLHLLVANLTPAEQVVTLAGLPVDRARRRRLNASTAPSAMLTPDEFRSAAKEATLDGAAPSLVLAPYELVRLDMFSS
jgi:hypothetical protein